MEQINQSMLPAAKTKPWFLRPWFITLAVLVVLWFGLPLVLRLFNLGSTEPEFTTVPGLEPTQAAISRSRLETSDDPSLGFAGAPVTIVEFGDFQCPFCRQAAPIIKQVLERYPEAVRLIYRDFPVTAIHSEAVPAAEAANCAAKQKPAVFWQYHDALYQRQAELGTELYLALADSLGLEREQFERCLRQRLTLTEIQTDLEAGLAASVRGTPTWFVNGRKIEGALPVETWDQIILSVLKSEFSP